MSALLRALLVAVTTAMVPERVSAAELPIPCTAGACGSGQSAVWVASGAATATATADTLRINQTSDQAILNWARFNVSADGNVIFNQPNASSIALNRIFQQSPSSILGRIQANGQIYLVNPNGFVFGSTSRINAAGILASTLKIEDSTFAGGLLAPALLARQLPALAADGKDFTGMPLLGSDGQPLDINLIVEKGAELSTNLAGGRVLLAAQNVSNAGSIKADDGQVVLAAGQKVYLQASGDPSLRGILVEVDGGGRAWNQISGKLSSDRGAITMVGLAVNQDGRISATTSVSANGSVQLLARDNIQVGSAGGVATLIPREGGRLILGSTSVIDVAPDLTDTHTAVDEQTQLASQVHLSASQIYLRSGASVTAKGGTINATTVRATGADPVYDPNAQIHVESGVTLDVSGSDVTLPMSSNFVTVQLRASELANSPTQRNGALRGQSVVVDTRVSGTYADGTSWRGTPLADVSGALRAIPKNVAQRTSTGGSVSFDSSGDIAVAHDALINVSGGTISFDGGTVQSSNLLTDTGLLVNIGSADPNATYVGVAQATTHVVHDRWGIIETFATPGTSAYSSGYMQGQSAGVVQFAAPRMALDPALRGNVTRGPFQRDPAAAPVGGRLIIGSPTGQGLTVPDYQAPSVTFTAAPAPIAIGDGASFPGPAALNLSTAYLDNGFTSTQIFSNGVVTLPASLDLNLGVGGRLDINARAVNVGSNVLAPGGSIALNSVITPGIRGLELPQAGLSVASGVVLDVRGNWTNDTLDPANAAPATPTAVNGGSIALTLTPNTGALRVGDDVQLQASGGAWLQTGGKLLGGRGGAITLQAGPTVSTEFGSRLGVDGFGVNGARGGSLSVEVARIDIGSGAAWLAPHAAAPLSAGGTQSFAPIQIGSGIFSDFGFSDLTFTATALRPDSGTSSVLRVLANSTLKANARSLVLDPLQGASRASAVDVLSVSVPELLPVAARSATHVNLLTVPKDFNGDPLRADGTLSFATGASLSGDPGAVFTLSSVGGILLDGEIRAPSGTINLSLPNPPSILDLGYRANQQISIGSHAVLDVSGTRVLDPSDAHPLNGKVLGGGSVRVSTQRGSIAIDKGSLIDVSGTTATVEIAIPGDQGYRTQTIGSAGGSLSLSAAEGVTAQGQFRAFAGAGDTRPAPGGSLNLLLNRVVKDSALLPTFPTNARIIQIQHSGDRPIFDNTNGLALLNEDLFATSGFDSLSFTADDRVVFNAGVHLAPARRLVINAPQVAVNGTGDVSLSADYVRLANPGLAGTIGTASYGAGRLTVNSSRLDLLGSIALQNLADVTLQSSGDIQMMGYDAGGESGSGSLAVAGDLTLIANRIFPSTGTRFSVTVGDSSNTQLPATLRVGQVGGAATVAPLSAAGHVSFAADRIIQDGTVMAPFGTISMTARESLSLGANGLTSVSGTGVQIPYGKVENGTNWVYGPARTDVTQVPARQILLSSPSVSQLPGSTVSIAGGGDLYAYEFVPGTGGTVDSLQPGQIAGLYAVLPTLRGQYAPYDAQSYLGSTLTPGDSVYLSGIAGLEAGVYPLLPATYGLLPGAYYVQAVAGTTGLTLGSGSTLIDGTPVVAGYRTVGNSGLGDPLYSGFAVRPGSYGRTLSEYTDRLASQFFAARATRLGASTPPLPRDSGQLSIAAQTSLDLRGTVNTLAATGGAGGRIAIAAPVLEVLGAGTASRVDGAVTITDSILTSWNPSQLLLGGVRTDDGLGIDVISSSVTVSGGARLAVDDLTLVAGQRINIDSGSQLASSSGISGATPSAAAFSTPATVTLHTADGAQAAILALSDTHQTRLVNPASAAGAVGSAARVALNAGASLLTHGSVLIGAPGGADLAGSVQGDGARWTLSGTRVVFGQESATDPAALTIAPALLGSLRGASSLSIDALQSVGFAAPLDLGTSTARSTLETLSINTASLRNLTPGIDVTLSARQVTLGGTSAELPATTVGAGALTLNGETVNLSSGTLAVVGFATTNLNAAGDLTVGGSTNLRAAGDLDLTARRVVVAGNSNSSVSATQTLNLARAASSSVAPSVVQPGGTLSLAADAVRIAGDIVAPSGLVRIRANSNLTMSGSASVDTSGMAVTAAGRQIGTPGGDITLSSGGALVLDAGTRLAVDGGKNAAAGRIALNAAAAAEVLATLHAAADAGSTGGAFSLRAGNLGDFAGLVDRLHSGGFTEAQNVSVAAGDLRLAADQSVRSRQVDWSTDSGTIEIAGNLDAPSGAQRGAIRLSAGSAVIIAGTGRLRADASSPQQRGGSIELATTGQDVRVLSGAIVSARGGVPGDLSITAPALTNDVAISALAGDFSGVGHVVVKPVVSANIADGSALDVTAVLSSATTFMSQAGATIASRLSSINAPLQIRPTAQVLSQSDINLGSLDLSAWRVGADPQPIDLQIRTAGSINVLGTVSDGFQSIQAGNSTYLDLLPGSSSSLTLVAGADLAAANALATSGAAANLNLADGAILRTGTGNIRLASAQDITFAPNASIYTAGVTGLPTQAPLVGASGPFSFPTGGGSTTMLAGRDIVGSKVQQSIAAWLPRQGTAPGTDPSRALSTQWGVDATKFQWEVGSFGGGDLVARAGRDIANLSIANADTAVVTGSHELTRFGGGNLELSAERNINSPMAFVARGEGRLRAGGAVGSSRLDRFDRSLTAFLATEAANIDVSARGAIGIEAVLNPQILPQVDQTRRQVSTFFTFSPESALSVSSVQGSVTLYTDPQRVLDFIGGRSTETTLLAPSIILPASLSLRAFSGDVLLTNTGVLFPSDAGQLDLFAGHDIRSVNNVGNLTMSDAPAASLPAVFAPQAGPISGALLGQLQSSGASGRHAADAAPVLITAGRDIAGEISFQIPKAAQLAAGRDIINLTLIGQNLRSGDVTGILAGRDFVDSPTARATVQLGGPGQLAVIAGRQVDLGFSAGVTTVGRLVNPALSSTGADLTILAGAAAGALDASKFISTVVEPSAANRQLLVNYVNAQPSETAQSYEAAAARFAALNADLQRPFLLRTFFSELVASGREANAGSKAGFTRGYNSINALFPGSGAGVTPDPKSNPYFGDVSLAFSRIYTLDGGTISILAPGGLLNVGLATPPTFVLSKTPSELGIVAQGAGDVRVFTAGDVLVNQSRVFTLGGGDIAMWSTLGNIDAGRGAKTSVSAPPPVVLVDAQGNVTVSFSGAVAGSGIRTILNSDTATPGNVDLIAPAGFVNAGDAGIGSSGNLNIAALKVIGVDNIQVGGTATGVPPATSGIGAALSGASNAASSASSASNAAFGGDEKSRDAAAPLANAALSWLDVFVTGLGEDACKPDDVECLKRQSRN